MLLFRQRGKMEQNNNSKPNHQPALVVQPSQEPKRIFIELQTSHSVKHSANNHSTQTLVSRGVNDDASTEQYVRHQLPSQIQRNLSSEDNSVHKTMPAHGGSSMATANTNNFTPRPPRFGGPTYPHFAVQQHLVPITNVQMDPQLIQGRPDIGHGFTNPSHAPDFTNPSHVPNFTNPSHVPDFTNPSHGPDFTNPSHVADFTNPSHVRYKTYYHLKGLFPEDRVRQAMIRLPNETDPHILCKAIMS